MSNLLPGCSKHPDILITDSKITAKQKEIVNEMKVKII